MRTSILMTVYNRSHRVLLNTLLQLVRNDLKDSEVVIINDGSTIDYEQVKKLLVKNKVPFMWHDINTIKDRPGTYNIRGFNNPAYAWNFAVKASKGERLVFLSSDCYVPAPCLRRSRKYPEHVYMPCVFDLDSSHAYLSQNHIYPMGWMMSIKREWFGEGFDEELLKGVDFDDNDFTARLLLEHPFLIDTSMVLVHQSHAAVAYSDGLAGRKRNDAYMRAKWGGIPWSGEKDDPLVLSHSVLPTKELELKGSLSGAAQLWRENLCTPS
jgi:glycosyltransferase involved in cell wall biosynthesis